MRLEFSISEGDPQRLIGVETMPTLENEIELLARAMIERHGAEAAKAAVARLNQMIDRNDWDGRDRWACVVRQIHQNQGMAHAFTQSDRARASRVA
jgi:hypothetical protein